MTLPFPPREEIARLTARMLLEIKAVHFNASEPFTYSSGLKGPTYIDCRKLISYPRIRSTLMDFLAATVLRDAGFDAFDNIAGGDSEGNVVQYAVVFNVERDMVKAQDLQRGFLLGKSYSSP